VLSPSIFIGKIEGREAGAATKNGQRGTSLLFFSLPRGRPRVRVYASGYGWHLFDV